MDADILCDSVQLSLSAKSISGAGTMALRAKLGHFGVCVTWLLCPRNLRSHAALALWWSCIFYNFFLLGSMWQYSPWLTQSCTKIGDQNGIWMHDPSVYYCRLLLCNLIKITVILSGIMANDLFIGTRFPYGKHKPAVDLLCSAHQKWAVSSLSVPTFLGFFWRQFSNVGVLVQWGSLQDKVRVGCLPLFLGTFPLTGKTGQGIDLTLSQMPLSDCHFKAELPLLWCVWIAQRECRYSYLVLEKMILENDCLCMKQSVPQARALNKYSKDVRASMFSAASKITFLMSYLLLLH